MGNTSFCAKKTNLVLVGVDSYETTGAYETMGPELIKNGLGTGTGTELKKRRPGTETATQIRNRGSGTEMGTEKFKKGDRGQKLRGQRSRRLRFRGHRFFEDRFFEGLSPSLAYLCSKELK